MSSAIHQVDRMVREDRDMTETSATYSVTPSMAEKMLRDWYFDGQRPLRRRHVQYLADEMRAGRFRRSSVDVRTVNDRVYLINGRHRLAAIVESGIPADLVIIALECSSMDQVRADYATFDRGLVRSYADAIVAYDLEATTMLTNAQLKRVSTAAPYIAVGFQARQRSDGQFMRSPMSRVEFLRVWSDVAVHAFSVVGESHSPHTRRVYSGPVFSVMLATFRYRPEAAEEFWRNLIENDGLRRTDPERALLDHLIATPVNSDNMSRMCRAVAAAWNAKQEQRSLQYIRVASTTAPIRLHGTPYDGRQHYAINPKTMLIDRAIDAVDAVEPDTGDAYGE